MFNFIGIPQEHMDFSAEVNNSGVCKNVSCLKEKNQLKAKCIDQEEKLNKINQGIETLAEISRQNGKNEKKVDIPTVEEKVSEESNESIACSSKSNSSTDTNKDQGPIFSTFDNVFSPEELAKLREIGPDKKKDSSFILQTIKFLYKEDYEKIASLTVTGLRAHEAKEKISTRNYDIFRNLYLERLESLRIYSAEFSERAKKLNSHIKTAIFTIRRMNFKFENN